MMENVVLAALQLDNMYIVAKRVFVFEWLKTDRAVLRFSEDYVTERKLAYRPNDGHLPLSSRNL